MCGIGLLSYPTYVHSRKILAGRYSVDFVNKTARGKRLACANEKRKRCNRIPSDRTLGRNDPSVGLLVIRYTFEYTLINTDTG